MKIIPAKNSTARQMVAETSSTSASDDMEEYNRLKLKLLVLTLASGVIIALVVWVWYGWKIALSYLVGALVGAVYLRMLAKGVDRLGNKSKSLGYARFGVFAILIAIAAKSEQLQVLPAFFGFMTYKIAVIAVLAQDLTSASRSR
ncbi:MAG: ATP synthase subunit I [Pseudanabaena sp.]|nr:MAG: ATP synthase subunit I [Pseudanabaena sp.]